MFWSSPELSLKHCSSDVVEEQETSMMENVNDGDDCKKSKPKPEKDVNLFVENVDWQYTLGIMSLDIATRTVFVECAFGNSRKYFGHWISSSVLMTFHE